MELTIRQAVAGWVRHQGLQGPVGSTPAEVVARTGWLRTLGGVDAYVALAARLPGLTAASLHEAVASRALVVTPAARGCIYLVPSAQAPLALALAADLTLGRTRREAAKAGVEDGELARVGEAVRERLAAGEATTRQLRKDLGDTVRSLGTAGKKVGLTTTLPPTLRELELAGAIVRQPVQDRLDHERYVWRLVESPRVDPQPQALRDGHLAALFMRWFAPASVSELASFTGLTKTRAKKAMVAAGAVEVTVEGQPCFVLPEQQGRLLEPLEATTHCLPGLDNLLVWHGGPAAFVHPDDLGRRLSVWGRQKGHTWGDVKHALTRVVLRDGVVSGIWEFDPDASRVICGPYTPGLPDDADARCDVVTTLLEEIGHGHAFSIETDAHLRARCHAVRAL